MATDDDRIFIHIDSDKFTDDAIEDYAEQLWQALTALLKEDPCP